LKLRSAGKTEIDQTNGNVENNENKCSPLKLDYTEPIKLSTAKAEHKQNEND
jgi:hypothetical protein